MRIVPRIPTDMGPVWTDCTNIYVSPWWWLSLSAGERNFVIRHEQAHCQGAPVSEEEADMMALDAHLADGGDPSDALRALARHPHTQDRYQLMSQVPMPTPRTGLGGYQFNNTKDPDAPKTAQTGGDDGGWDADDWLTALQMGLASAPGIIASARGQNRLPGNTWDFQQQPRRNWLPWIIGGVLVLGLGYFLLKR